MKKITVAVLLVLGNSLKAQESNSEYVEMSIDDAYAHLQAGNLNVLDNKHKVTLKNVHFEKGTATLSLEDKKYLDSLSNYLKLIPTVSLALKGYTDNMGSYRMNVDLSKKRAKMVSDHLRDKGIPQVQLSSEGLGPIDPVANNLTREGRSLNRRVELHFNSDLFGAPPTENYWGKKKNTPPATAPKPNTITLNDGTVISTDFFMAHTDGKTIGYRDRSTKAYKKLRIPDIRSIQLPGGEMYDLKKIPPAASVRIEPSEKARQEIEKITGLELPRADGVKNKKSDTLAANSGMKQPNSAQAKKDSLRNQPEKVRLAKHDTVKPTFFEKLFSKKNRSKMDWTSLDFSKQVSKDGIMGRIEQQAEITRAEILNMIVSRALYSTRPFLFFGWYPLSAKPVTGLYSQRYGSDTLVRLNFKNGSSRSYFSFTIGLEKEIGKTMPKYYTRLGFCYGGNSASNWFTSICVGGGKLLGKKRQHNAGIDLAYTLCSDVLGNHYFKKAATIMENDFIGSVSFRLRSTQLTLAPNISYEYSAPGYGYLRRTVRFTLGLPLSIPLRSEVIATGINTNGVEATSVTRLKRAPDAELYIDGVRKKNYALSKLTGFSFTLGYVFN